MIRPAWVLRQQHRIDGIESRTCWTDHPASFRGRMRNKNLVGVSAPGGEHEPVLEDMVFPPAWTRRFVPMLPGAVPDVGK